MISTMRRKFETNIHRNETTRPRSQFLWAIYILYSHDRSAYCSHDRSAYFAPMIGLPILLSWSVCLFCSHDRSAYFALTIGLPILLSWSVCLFCSYDRSAYFALMIGLPILLPWSVCLFCCIGFADQSWEYINRSQIHEYRTRPRSLISGNICFEFSVQWICSAS